MNSVYEYKILGLFHEIKANIVDYVSAYETGIVMIFTLTGICYEHNGSL